MSENIKRFIKTIFAFIPFAIIIYVIMLCAWGDIAPYFLKKNLTYRIGSNGHLFTRLKEVKTVKDVDVLVLGSSHAYREFDPRIFNAAGLKTFNLGSSAQTPMQTKILLERYLDKLNPKIVIYEVFPKTFSIDGVESSLDIISNDKNDLASLKMAIDLAHIVTVNTLIYGYYRDITGKNKSFVEKQETDIDKYIKGGYVARKIKTFKHQKYPANKWDFEDKQFEYFKENLNLLKSRNIRVILINSPIPPAYYKSYTNNNVFDARMEKMGEYYNFNNKLTLDDSIYFYDTDHLNQNGVDIFDAKILSEIFKK